MNNAATIVATLEPSIQEVTTIQPNVVPAQTDQATSSLNVQDAHVEVSTQGPEGSNVSIGTPLHGQEASLIDHDRKRKLEAKFNETINNPRFWSKPSRPAELEAALIIPVFDDRSLQQFYNHAMDDLTNEAAKQSARDGIPVVLPTEEEVIAEAWSRFTKKQMALEGKALQTERKKEAELTGRHPVPVTNEEVIARVDAIVAKLRIAEGV